ncbi:hypothetical protein [Sphingosinicella sp. BN140058]|uniref:hypothetical protein n=1 Tax=Sphingosinicella sp. BN140058 TaxID=1892855 RepID=UPI001012293C|nr:hypothetical protein [Sphingosinicella sp. BN140058]QAY78062.1 hypothetical protein ETR14_17185 [Sphingosinicella sp. BN140058]
MENRPQGRVLELVSCRTARQVECYQAANGIVAPLQRLAAGLLRVMRGSGEPEHIGFLCGAVLDALEEHRQILGSYPDGNAIAAALHLGLEEAQAGTDAEGAGIARAQRMMISGALQVCASSLLSQAVQTRNGERELLAGAMDAVRNLTEGAIG